MKFTYAYKTSDGVRHEDSMNAQSREEVFAALRAKGIKAIKVVAADGSKANGATYGVRKRIVTAIAILAALAAGGLSFWFGRTRTPSAPSSAPDFVTDMTRRQLIGDMGVIELGIKDGWSDVFTLEGDRFLAGFCIPGTEVAVRSVTEDALRKALESDFPATLVAEPSKLSLEARQIVAIVTGMKREIRELVADGWTLREVGDALVSRQEKEIAYYNRAKTEIEMAKKANRSEDEVVELWKKRNEELRVMGVRLVPLPE